MAPMHSTEPHTGISIRDRERLLTIARASIVHGFEHKRSLSESQLNRAGLLQGRLAESGASFITLTKYDTLRGCTGSLEAKVPLAADVADNAYHTAFKDYRFSPLEFSELADLRIEVTVLSPQTEIMVDSERDLLESLIPHEDGLVIDDGLHRATFLPKVWEQVPEPRRFVMELKRKAGLPDEYWSNAMRAFRYHTESFAEPGEKLP